MTIWILVSVMLLSLAAVGFRQGAIRMSFSLVGIIVSALLAGPLAKYVKPMLPHAGIHDQTLIWLLSPVVVFVVLLIPFKTAGYFVHRKAELYFKYKSEGMQLIRWIRLNTRLGLCLGLVNGLAYLVLLSFIIFNASYWTAQIATSDNEGRLVKLLNRLGRDSETTGFAQIARAINPMPEISFKAADLAGLLCQNPQLRDRLADYPMLVSVAERDDFQQLGQDSDFQNAWKQHVPIWSLINSPPFKSIWQNPDAVNLVWGIVQDNFDDLYAYLQTGQPSKYGTEKIIGRWNFNAGATTAIMLQSRTVISSREMRAMRAAMTQSYARTAFVAGADGQAFLKNLPHFRTPTTFDTATWQGQWKNAGANYNLSLSSVNRRQSMPAQIDADGTRLTIVDDKNKTTLVFDREK
jgi:uncharacterized membrane protein required for colicin V production